MASSVQSNKMQLLSPRCAAASPRCLVDDTVAMAAVRLAAAVLLGVAVVPHAASKTNRTEPKLALGNSCP